jgi:hypothetical protein
MNKLNLSALLLSALLSAPAAAAPTFSRLSPTIISADANQTISYDMLYTEADWQRVQLSDEVVAMLGDLRAVTLTVSGLPENVEVKLSGKPGPVGTLGLEITRQDSRKPLRQMAAFTLTNPATRQSYTFEAMVSGSGKD